MTTSPCAAGSWAIASYRVARGLITISQGREDCCGWTMMRRQMCPSAPELSHLERALNHVIHQWAKRQSTWSLKSLLLTNSGKSWAIPFSNSTVQVVGPGGSGTQAPWEGGCRGCYSFLCAENPQGRTSHPKSRLPCVIPSSEFSSVDRETFRGDALLGKTFP